MNQIGEGLSSLKITDMIFVLLVPAVIGILTSNTEWFWTRLAMFKQSLRREYVRYIVHIQSTDYYFMLKQDNRNNILQKAISLYVGELQDKEKYQSGQFRLMRVDDSSDENKCWTEKMDHTRSSAELKKFQLKTLPQLRKWTEVEKGIWLNHHEVPDDAPAGQERMIHTIELKTYRRNGYEHIDAFIEKCYRKYIERLRKEMDQGRYLYQLQVGAKGSGDSDSGSSKMIFKKYRLTDDKAFDSLFFPEKKEVMALVDDFVGRKGKFSIEGFPNKLGLLLHGPPGTGKTSFVKALSHYTDRHIVSVPLSKLKTNQELYDIMFDRVYPCREDDGVPQRLDFDKVIFLMEDVDAATDIVKSRARAMQAPTDEMKKLLKELRKEEKKKNKKKGKKDSASDGEEDGSGSDFDMTDENGPISKSAWEKLFDRMDKLDLSGLLNILDGVVDSPGRIVIMTTNQPDSLDAALIRPGRINTKLHMTYMATPEFVEMVEQHFGALGSMQKRALISAFEGKTTLGKEFLISGAEVEQLCAEYDTIEEFIAGLEQFPRLPNLESPSH